MNTSLALPAPAPPDRKAPVRGCAAPRSPGPQPACAPPGPAEPPKGPGASAAPAGRAGPGSAIGSVIIIGDEWDDIDDFDLSGIEKKFSRPPLVSPKGLRAPRKEPPRPSPRPAPPGSPGPAAEHEGPGGSHGEAAAEQRPCSQSSVICLEESAPCSGSSAAGLGLWESPADPPRDADGAGARPGNALCHPCDSRTHGQSVGVCEGTLSWNTCACTQRAWLGRSQRELGAQADFIQAPGCLLPVCWSYKTSHMAFLKWSIIYRDLMERKALRKFIREKHKVILHLKEI